MSGTFGSLKAFLDGHAQAVLVEVAAAQGSTPREEGAWMLVSPTAIFGTIGGGQLEFRAIEKARGLLSAGADGPLSLSVPLGPEIGQCCGGRVELTLRRIDSSLSHELVERARREDSTQPHVYIFGGGHVGHALLAALGLLPVYALLVETRAEALQGLPEGAATRLTPVPEEAVTAAPPGSAFVVLTHDHALDFLIVAAALARRDAAYVGMIGSKTKKATFRSWYLKTGGGSEADFTRLVSPIGGISVRDKRPAVIAALTAAEIMTVLAGQHSRRG